MKKDNLFAIKSDIKAILKHFTGLDSVGGQATVSRADLYRIFVFLSYRWGDFAFKSITTVCTKCEAYEDCLRIRRVYKLNSAEESDVVLDFWWVPFEVRTKKTESYLVISCLKKSRLAESFLFVHKPKEEFCPDVFSKVKVALRLAEKEGGSDE